MNKKYTGNIEGSGCSDEKELSVSNATAEYLRALDRKIQSSRSRKAVDSLFSSEEPNLRESFTPEG